MKLSAKELGSFARLHGRTLLDPTAKYYGLTGPAQAFQSASEVKRSEQG
jgi:hypothetical protein